MYSAALAILLVGSVLFQDPDPIPTPEPGLNIPAGALPWAMPQFPVVDIDLGLATPTYDEVGHTEDYETTIAEIEARIGSGQTVDEDFDTEMEDWIGPDANIPDLSSDDFDTGISVPGYTDMSADDIATAFGTNVGTLFQRIRALTTIDVDLGGIIGVFAAIGLCIAWMAIVGMIKFGIQFIDMAFQVVTTLIELIPFVE